MRLAWLLAGLLAVAGCGDKIVLPVAQGIPTSSLYLEDRPWQLTDPTDVLEVGGRLVVTEGAPGTVTKYRTNGDVQFAAEGLGLPVGLAEIDAANLILVGEANGPAVSVFEDLGLEFRDRVDLSGLVKSLAALATDGSFVYISDPDSGVVHRFAWVGAGGGWMTPQGVVCNDRGSAASPRFVREPRGLALDPDGMLLVCDADTTRNWVVRFDPQPPPGDPNGLGTLAAFRTESCPTPPADTFVLGDAPGCQQTDFEPAPFREPGVLYAPSGIAVDDEGRLYVADRFNQRVQRFTLEGFFDTSLGDGAGEVEPLNGPVRLTTWLGDTTFDGVRIRIPGARVYVIDRDLAQLRIFEDKRWSDFEGR